MAAMSTQTASLASPVPSRSWFGVDLHWFYSDLLHAVLRRTQCRHRAGDVLHDALIRYAATALRQPIEQPHAYLRRVVDTTLADHYRGEARFVPLPDEADAPLEAGMDVAWAPSAEQLAELRQRLAWMQTVLEALPPRCREVFWLLRVEGCTQPEIAQRLGIGLKTVEGHVARALLQLNALRGTFLAD